MRINMPVLGTRLGNGALVVGMSAPVIMRFLCSASAAAAGVVADSFLPAGSSAAGEATVNDKFSVAPYSSAFDCVTSAERLDLSSQDDSMRKLRSRSTNKREIAPSELSTLMAEEDGKEKEKAKVLKATPMLRNGMQSFEKSSRSGKREAAFKQAEQEAMKGLKGLGAIEKAVDVKTRSISCRILIHKFCSDGQVSEALDVLDEMYKQKLVLTQNTFHPILRRFSDYFMLNEAFETLAVMRRMKVRPTIQNYNLVIKSCSKSGNMEKAYWCLRELQQHGVKPVSKSFYYIVKGFCKQDRFKRAKAVLQEMVQAGCKPDKHIYKALLVTCVESQNFNWALEVIKDMHHDGLETKDVVPVVMSAFHVWSVKPDDAIKAVNELQTKVNDVGLGLKNQLLLQLARAGHLDKAQELFHDMRIGGKCLNQGSAFTLLAAYGQAGKLDRMVEIFEESICQGSSREPLKLKSSNHYVTVSCIHMVLSFIQHKQFGRAVKFLQQMSEQGILNDGVLFDKIFLHIATYCSDRSIEHATGVSDGLAVLEVMRELDLRPSRIALEALLDCCSSSPGNLGKAIDIVQEMEKECLPLNIFSKIRLFRIFVIARSEGEALRVLDQMSSDDLRDSDVQVLLNSILELRRSDQHAGENGSLDKAIDKVTEQVHRRFTEVDGWPRVAALPGLLPFKCVTLEANSCPKL